MEPKAMRRARSRPFEGLGLRTEQHAAPRKPEHPLHTLCLTPAVWYGVGIRWWVFFFFFGVYTPFPRREP